MDYKVSDFGAKGDGSTVDTAAIQAAVDRCGQAGGGRVVFEGGRIYRCGTLILHSYVELHLEMGAVLKGSDNLDDFNLMAGGHVEPEPLKCPTYVNCEYGGKAPIYFIYAKDCEYVSITGPGKIDGNEEIFHGVDSGYHIDGAFYPRVPLLFLEHVQHLTIKEVTLTNSAFWTTHLIGCEDVLIEGVRIINNLRMANCDGIDPDHCRDVRIIGCHIECADDCIVFKNTAKYMQYGPCRDITVQGCTLTSTSAAIKFGTESEDLFCNITVSNCIIRRTNRAISLQLRDKGSIENVIFSNINIETRLFSPAHWWGKAEPIAITCLSRKEGVQAGRIRNVTLENINAVSEGGILIYGEERSDGQPAIEGVRIRNMSLRLVNSSKWPKGAVDTRPCKGDGLKEGPLHAVNIYGADDIRIEDIRVTMDEKTAGTIGELTDIRSCGRVICQV